MITQTAQVLSPTFPDRATPATWSQATGQIPCGVGLVTGGTGEARFVATALSVAPLSANPPTLILCLDTQSATRRAEVAGLKRVGVSILAAQHRGLAETSWPNRTMGDDEAGRGVEWRALAKGAIVVADAIAAFDCRIEEIVERHGRAIIIGAIEAMQSNRAASALLHWRGDYDRVGWSDAEIACATGIRAR